MALSPAVNLVMKMCVLTSNCDNKACCSSSLPSHPSVGRARAICASGNDDISRAAVVAAAPRHSQTIGTTRP